MRTGDEHDGEVALADLHPHEKLRIWRRRVGLTQDEAGRRFDVSGWTYGEMERGAVPVPAYAWRGPFHLHPHEKCLIYRLRSGSSQDEVASELGCSRLWVLQMESGRVNCDRLIEYWEC